jgi:predicted enzyme related to lactoylglutathione lyase
VHFDIAGPDTDILREFYAAVMSWSVQSQGPGYALIETGGVGPNGAIVETEEASITIGLAVADLGATLADAERRGGTIIMPATDNGWVVKAQIKDPAGNFITLIQA